MNLIVLKALKATPATEQHKKLRLTSLVIYRFKLKRGVLAYKTIANNL
jgi:hypothetical protein